MSRVFENKSKSKFLSNIPDLEIGNDSCIIASKCKFNLSFFCFEPGVSQNFSEWDHPKLVKLLDKLKFYSEFSLDYWKKQRIGRKNNNVLEVYGKFPLNSDFAKPKHVPINAMWARFRLESDMRLIGFVIPDALDKITANSNFTYCRNTFYITHLDEFHRFYKKTR